MDRYDTDLHTVSDTISDIEDSLMLEHSTLLEKRFLVAAMTRDRREMTLCLESGVNPNVFFKHTRTTALHCFAERGDVTFAIRLLMNPDVLVDVQDEEHYTPLHLAAIFGKLKMTVLLVRCGADINFPTRLGRTPLMLACRCRHADIAKHLLGRGAMVNVNDYFGGSPLAIAANEDDTHMVGLLLKYGADPMIQMHGQLPLLFELILKCHNDYCVDMIRTVLELGADDSEDFEDLTTGKNCLHYVALTGNLLLAEVLLRWCRGVNKEDIAGRTPLDVAVLTGDRDMIELLASVHYPNRDHSRFIPNTLFDMHDDDDHHHHHTATRYHSLR